MSKRIGSTPRKAAQDVCQVCQKDLKDKRQKHRLFTAAGCSAALPFHSSDPDPDARTSRDDLRPSPVTTTRSLLPTGEDRQVMHLSTSYTPNFPRQTAVLSDIKAYGQTSSSCSCSATCASSVRASTNAGEQALYNIHATGILVHATSSTDATETSTPERNLGTSIRYCLVKGFWRERQRHSLQQTISGRNDYVVSDEAALPMVIG